MAEVFRRIDEYRAGETKQLEKAISEIEKKIHSIEDEKSRMYEVWWAQVEPLIEQHATEQQMEEIGQSEVDTENKVILFYSHLEFAIKEIEDSAYMPEEIKPLCKKLLEFIHKKIPPNPKEIQFYADTFITSTIKPYDKEKERFKNRKRRSASPNTESDAERD